VGGWVGGCFSLQRMYLHLCYLTVGGWDYLAMALQSRAVCNQGVAYVYMYMHTFFSFCSLFIMGVLCGVGFLLCFNNFLLFIFFLYTYNFISMIKKKVEGMEWWGPIL
jgi:hypothetical protein